MPEAEMQEYEAVFADGKSVCFESDQPIDTIWIAADAETAYECQYRASPFDDGWAYDHFEFPKIVSIRKVSN